jgi:hypothetical protein
MPCLPFSTSQPSRIRDSGIKLAVRYVAAIDDASKGLNQEDAGVGHNGKLPQGYRFGNIAIGFNKIGRLCLVISVAC